MMISIDDYAEFQAHNVEQFTQNNTKIPQLDLLHSVIGVCEELLELSTATDPEHKIEELGDLLFYHTVLTHMLGINPHVMLQSTPSVELSRDELINKLLGITKKYVFHGKPIYRSDMQDYLLSILLLCNLEDYDIPAVIEYNKDKLRTRYPNGRADNIFNKLHALTLNIV